MLLRGGAAAFVLIIPKFVLLKIDVGIESLFLLLGLGLAVGPAMLVMETVP